MIQVPGPYAHELKRLEQTVPVGIWYHWLLDIRMAMEYPAAMLPQMVTDGLPKPGQVRPQVPAPEPATVRPKWILWQWIGLALVLVATLVAVAALMR